MLAPVLLIGRGGSRGVPKKNIMPVMGRPLMTYPIIAAKNSKHTGEIFLSTDSEEIKSIGRSFSTTIVDRPAELCSDHALVEDVVVHGYNEICKMNGAVDIFVLLFCNTATITPGLIDRGIEVLKSDSSIDSAVSVSLYNEYSPVRAKRISKEGFVLPYGDVDAIESASCDRDTAEPCYFCDCSIWVLRKSCMDIENGILPFRWMGKKTVPLYQKGGLDIDHDYGIALTEFWLRSNGFTEDRTPYDT